MDTDADTTTAGARVAAPATNRLGTMGSLRDDDNDGDDEALNDGDPAPIFQDAGISESRHDDG